MDCRECECDADAFNCGHVKAMEVHVGPTKHHMYGEAENLKKKIRKGKEVMNRGNKYIQIKAGHLVNVTRYRYFNVLP